ncbi:hypothetical protein K493DRAFT_85525 [Basidiobolus meristosporus CBS 931.73]|uniref:Uncharacterized protein n=1 Tax=Basidiobolus meristosporus CBS 931.73 TaxID=1314790 RepID=A0A1Y1XHZ2_9FUNG|nr:hypothetical protein K493DRAFT_85525 [Basidiobolus meristosporus CBS 931.73]|eukprot:ORX85378.1 hypothetical protein K493DRAFT_85525 [Basidiobolus meristosporus CBS 931.73]
MDPFDALLNYRPAPQPLSQPQPPTSSFDSLFGVASSTPQPPVTASFSSFEQKFPPTDLYHASPVEPSSMVEKKGNRNSISHLFQLQLQSQPRPQPQPSHADPPAATQDSSNPAMDDFLAELTGNKGGPVAPSTGFGYLPAGDSMSSHFSAKGAYDRQNGTNQTFGLDRGHPFIPGNSAMHSFVDQTAPVNPIYQPTSGEGRSPFQPTPSYPGNSAKANPFFTSQASHAPNRSASVPVSSEGSKPLFPVAGNYGSSLKNSPQSLQASPPPLRSESPFSQPFRSMSYSPSASSPQSPSIPGKNPFSANNEGSSQPPTVANPFGANRTVEKGIVTSASIFGNNSRTNHRFGNTSLNQTASSSFLDDLDPLKNDVKFGGSSLKNENKWYH